jgi:hypothetical protein
MTNATLEQLREGLLAKPAVRDADPRRRECPADHPVLIE